jgi:serine/threonine protein kinase
MGEVYRAHNARLDREVAIKVLPADFAADKDQLQRFEQEAKATPSRLVDSCVPVVCQLHLPYLTTREL